MITAPDLPRRVVERAPIRPGEWCGVSVILGVLDAHGAPRR
jgi:hypothetical protein